MNSKLLELRSNSYAAAVAFHRVASEYFTALRDRSAGGEDSPVLVALEEAATVYDNTLEDLLAHLGTLRPEPAVREEMRRTARIRELLRHESELMGHFRPD